MHVCIMHVCMYVCMLWSDPPHDGGSGSIGDVFRQGKGSISICFIIDSADVEVAVGLVGVLLRLVQHVLELTLGDCAFLGHPRVPLDEHVVHIAQTSSE